MSLQRCDFAPFVGKPVREVSLPGDFRIVERTYAPGMRVPMHSHDRAFVGVTLSGVYLQMHKGIRQEFRPGSISFTPAAEPHESEYSDTGARVLYIEIPGGVLEHLSSIGLSSEVYTLLQGGTCHVAAQQLYREFQTQDALSPLVLGGLTMRFLAQIFRQQGNGSSGHAKWLYDAETFICRNFANSLSLDEIAKAVQVHPVHLARQYRRHYGHTIGERIRELRFEIACKQLLNTSRPLVEIALSTGYSDQSHFSVAFKKHMGIAPSAYRNHHSSCGC